MTRLELRTGSEAPASFGTLFSTAAALTSPVQGMLGRPLYGVPPLQRARARLAARSTPLLLWHERARQRRQLLELDDDMLRDIGITRADAVGEAGKPFWRG